MSWLARGLIPNYDNDADESAWTPAALGPLMWLDASYAFSDAGTTRAVDTDPVYQLADRSGNGYHAVQTTLGARPILTNDGVNPAYITFDGTDDYLSIALGSEIDSGTELTISISFLSSGPNLSGVFNTTGGGNYTSIENFGSQSPANCYFNGAAAVGVSVTAGAALNAIYTFNSGARKSYKNGTFVASASSGASLTTHTHAAEIGRIGWVSNYAAMRLYQLVVVPREVTADERALLAAYGI